MNKNKVSPKKVGSPVKEPVSRIAPNKEKSLLVVPITTGRTRKQEEEKRIRFVRIISLTLRYDFATFVDTLFVAKDRLMITSKTTALGVPQVLCNLKKSYLRYFREVIGPKIRCPQMSRNRMIRIAARANEWGPLTL